MPTIAELQVNVDTTQMDHGTTSMNAFAVAAEKAAKARKALNDANAGGGGPGGGGGGSDDPATKKVKNLSEAIDNQTKKLSDLNAQRKALADSKLKTENPEEYKRLNTVLDTRIELVRRQGNALDTLAAKQAQSAKAEAALQETAKKAVESREALESRFALAQQRQLDSTIAGLSKQVKAQQEYNRTVEQLNTARVTGGMNGGPSMSSAEHDTWVKLAAAKRDAALAEAGNTSEVERARRQMDAMTSTLGKAELAEFRYARAVTVLNDGQRLGLITADEYNTKLTAFAAKRDKAIAAADHNTESERKFASQLQSVLSAYDPVIRANDVYNSSVKTLSQGLQSGQLSVEQFNKALTAQRHALDEVKSSQTGSPEHQARQYQAAIDRLVPMNAQLRNLAEAEKVLQQTKAAGHVTTEQQIKDYDRATKAIAAERAEIERRNSIGSKGNSAKQNQAALNGLPAQFTDVVVSLQGGQNPLTVLLQQGGQVKDMFGGVGNAAKAVGGALLSMVNPASIAIASIVSLGYVLHSGSAEATDFNKSLAASANFSGASTNRLLELQGSISSVSGTMGLAAESLTAMTASGKISVDQFEAIGIAAAKMQRTTGQEIQKTVDEFASLAKDPASAVITLNEKYNFLTSAVYAQITALQRQGDEMGATALAQQEMAAGAANMADNIKANLGTIETVWKNIREAAAEGWDAMLGVGRTQDIDTQIASKQKILDDRKTGLLGFLNLDGLSENSASTKFIEGEIKALKRSKAQLEENEKAQSLVTQSKRKATEAQKFNDNEEMSSRTQLQVLEDKLKLSRVKNKEIAEEASRLGVKVSPEQIEQQARIISNLDKKIKDEKDRLAKANAPKSVPLDTREIQDVKSNLSVITSEYDGYYKKVTALGDSHIVSAAATAASQKAILDAESKAITEAYDEQIDAIKKLQGNKKNTAAQNISLDNQLTKAQDAQLKAQQDIAAKREVIGIKEKADLDKRTESILAYNEALQQQIENTRIVGQRAVAAVGQGDRVGKLNDDLGQADRDFGKEQLKLSKQKGTMDPVEYASKLKDLTDAHTEMRDVIISNDKDIQKANGQWTNGLTKALQNAADEGANFASTVNSAVSGAFDSMGDAFGEFVTTGKLSFRDLTVSILSNMAKLAAQQASSALLSSLFGAVLSGIGGGAGATNGFAAGSAGATSSAAGASQAGYNNISSWQEKGGAWSGGTQMFANGGAFTNSIVSQPTSFGMANGAQGIMGEKKPEAIIPLSRTSTGELGVRMTGGGGGGGTVVNVNVQVAEGSSSSSSDGGDSWNQFGNEMGAFVEKKVYTIINSETRPGGSLQAQNGR